MTVTVVVGAQRGDEGNGRVVDYLAVRADMAIRFPGGDNAGHTVVNDYGRFALHLIPCGIFSPSVRCLLGAGTVINLDTLEFWIDLRAHLIWPYHRLLDGAEEDRRRGKARGAGSAPRAQAQGDESIGTTRRGIGPVYADKHAYNGIRAGDLHDPLRRRLELLLPLKKRELAYYGLQQFTVDELMHLAEAWREVHGRPHPLRLGRPRALADDRWSRGKRP